MLMQITRDILLTAAESKAVDTTGKTLCYFVHCVYGSTDILSLSVKEELKSLGFSWE
jgi:hypothetical protein